MPSISAQAAFQQLTYRGPCLSLYRPVQEQEVSHRFSAKEIKDSRTPALDPDQRIVA